MRDGGLVNDFYFTDEFVKDLYDANAVDGESKTSHDEIDTNPQ